jgi:uncharacterized protein (TIGR02217 family)
VTLTFPAFAGQDIQVKKTPKFNTIRFEHVSGREVRSQPWANPVWEFELIFNGLSGVTGGNYAGLGSQSLQSLMGFFLSAGGMAQSFLFYDPTDYAVSAQAFGTGTGAQTAFQLVRTLGTFNEWITQPVLSTTTLNFANFGITATAPVITSNGTTVASSAYSISNGVVTFTTAPASGAALAWSGYYAFLCRFDDDALDFEQFLTNLWAAKQVKFRSLRAQ